MQHSSKNRERFLTPQNLRVEPVESGRVIGGVPSWTSSRRPPPRSSREGAWERSWCCSSPLVGPTDPDRLPPNLPHQASHTRSREGSKKSQTEKHHLHLTTQVNFGSRNGRVVTKSGVSTMGYGVGPVSIIPQPPTPSPTYPIQGRSKRSQTKKLSSVHTFRKELWESRWESSVQVGCADRGVGGWGMIDTGPTPCQGDRPRVVDLPTGEGLDADRLGTTAGTQRLSGRRRRRMNVSALPATLSSRSRGAPHHPLASPSRRAASLHTRDEGNVAGARRREPFVSASAPTDRPALHWMTDLPPYFPPLDTECDCTGCACDDS